MTGSVEPAQAALKPAGSACCGIFNNVRERLQEDLERPKSDVDAIKRGCTMVFGHAMTVPEGTWSAGARAVEQGLLRLGDRMGIVKTDLRNWQDYRYETGPRSYRKCALQRCMIDRDLKTCSRCKAVACASSSHAKPFDSRRLLSRAPGPVRNSHDPALTSCRDWKVGHQRRCVRPKSFFDSVRSPASRELTAAVLISARAQRAASEQRRRIGRTVSMRDVQCSSASTSSLAR